MLPNDGFVLARPIFCLFCNLAFRLLHVLLWNPSRYQKACYASLCWGLCMWVLTIRFDIFGGTGRKHHTMFDASVILDCHLTCVTSVQPSSREYLLLDWFSRGIWFASSILPVVVYVFWDLKVFSCLWKKYRPNVVNIHTKSIAMIFCCMSRIILYSGLC